jgi:hypothetical protein
MKREEAAILTAIQRKHGSNLLAYYEDEHVLVVDNEDGDIVFVQCVWEFGKFPDAEPMSMQKFEEIASDFLYDHGPIDAEVKCVLAELRILSMDSGFIRFVPVSFRKED